MDAVLFFRAQRVKILASNTDYFAFVGYATGLFLFIIFYSRKKIAVGKATADRENKWRRIGHENS